MLSGVSAKNFYLGILLSVGLVGLVSHGILNFDSWRVTSSAWFALSLVVSFVALLLFKDAKSPSFTTYFLLLTLIGSSVMSLREYSGVELAYFCLFISSIHFCSKVTHIKGDRTKGGVFGFCIGFVVSYAFVALFWFVLLLVNNPEFETSFVLPWGFENIRYWSHLATWILPLLPALASIGVMKTSSRLRILVYISFAVWVWIAVASGARGTWVAVSLGCLLAYPFANSSARRGVRSSFLSLLSISLFVIVIFELILPSLLSTSSSLRLLRFSMSGRWPLWVEAFEMSLINFPFGMGPQSWIAHDVITDEYAGSLRFGHPHNMYLMWAAEYGWITVISAFLGIMLAIGKLPVQIFRKRDDESGDVVVYSLLASFFAACIHALVSAVFLAPASLLLGWFVVTALLARIRNAAIKPAVVNAIARNQNVVQDYLVVACLSLAIVAFFTALFSYKRDAETDRTCYTYMAVAASNGPRFWLHGDFPRPPSLACDESRIPEDVRRTLD